MLETEAVFKILEEIRKDQHKASIALEAIKGEIKLQSQSLKHHIDNLTEFKASTTKKQEDLEKRVDSLEGWRIKIVAISTSVAAVAALLVQDIKRALFG